MATSQEARLQFSLLQRKVRGGEKVAIGDGLRPPNPGTEVSPKVPETVTVFFRVLYRPQTVSDLIVAWYLLDGRVSYLTEQRKESRLLRPSGT
jgi:hypothetical protein